MTIYDLDLHEDLKMTDGKQADWYITRVAGGWIYSSLGLEYPTSVFVPYSIEFLKVKS